LFELYSRGLDVQVSYIDAVIQRSEGVSAAFIRELLRKATLLAAEEDGTGDRLSVRDQHVNRAFEELLIAGGVMTQRLLGAKPAHRQPIPSE
jgi:hypothetical protein